MLLRMIFTGTSKALVNLDHVVFIDVTAVTGGWAVRATTEAVSTRSFTSVTIYASEPDAWVGADALVANPIVDTIRES